MTAYMAFWHESADRGHSNTFDLMFAVEDNALGSLDDEVSVLAAQLNGRRRGSNAMPPRSSRTHLRCSQARSYLFVITRLRLVRRDYRRCRSWSCR